MIAFPVVDTAVLAKRDRILADLAKLVPAGSLIHAHDALRVYETDAFTAYRRVPLAVALPATAAEVSAILAYCYAQNIRVVPRGSGTSLSGGAIPLEDAVLLGLGKLSHIKKIDPLHRTVTVEPGVTNLAISAAVAAHGLYYAPDPSSQFACSIGGNVAENSGGVHCLKYGLTTNNLLGVEIVLMNGEVLRLGGEHFDSGHYDWLGLVTGSEGLLGVVTEVTVRVLPKPETARALLISFDSIGAASQCVAAIIAAGIIPAGMELMDRAATQAAEAFVHAGYPANAEALMIVELDGPQAEVDALIERVQAIVSRFGALECRASRDEHERLRFWAGRKAAFSAVAKLAPDYLCMDGTIPRARLADVLERIANLSRDYGLQVVNVFHAGDGNLHPLILYDANNAGELDRAERFGADILRLCVDAGGVLTGEHGVGLEKRDLMDYQFNEHELELQQDLKRAFDPTLLLNPGKVFPRLHRCAEQGQMHVHRGEMKFADLPRF
jgi:glycolate oxidase